MERVSCFFAIACVFALILGALPCCGDNDSDETGTDGDSDSDSDSDSDGDTDADTDTDTDTSTVNPGGPGERIVYVRSLPDNGNSQIYSAALDGSDEVQLTDSAEQHGEPAWSPDGKYIAFKTRKDFSELFGISVMDHDGANVRELVVSSDEYRDLGDPTWSPDGARIAFHASVPDRGFDIFVMNSDGTGLETLYSTDKSESNASWSPDGETIAFQGYLSLWIVDSDGTNARVVVDSLSEMYTVEPAWSRDGESIVFSAGDYEADLYTVKPDGSDLTQLTFEPKGEYTPSFSADGQKLAFYNHTASDESGIYFIDLETGALEMVAVGMDPDCQP